jgi:hypothetical protein
VDESPSLKAAGKREEESEAAGCNGGPIISMFAFMHCPCYAIYWSITNCILYMYIKLKSSRA